MAERGAQKGNQNARKGNQWRQAIRKALARYSAEQGDKPKATRGLELVAHKFIEAAAAGEPWAMKELGDRMDGKPVQSTEISSPDGPVAVEYTILPVTPIDKADADSPETTES